MKLTQEQMNAVYAQAKRCTDDLKAALKEKPKRGWNTVVPPILRKHYEKVKPFGISLIEFNSIIGRQNGRFGVSE
jgi:hypothetical protein